MYCFYSSNKILHIYLSQKIILQLIMWLMNYQIIRTYTHIFYRNLKAISKCTVPVTENTIDPFSTESEYRILWLRFSRVVATSQFFKKMFRNTNLTHI